ncbi:hypothetical protein BX616_007638 [Lobosporangium transversale]|uniref:Mid2 domain-containing protein n=1 Tax=Lobosporangium transversale TaxID=64571 RepID=A0A1Y2GEZ5_9FUNG|nr:hypothetical protein BCR41DRAFT_388743 [Lobosporangium transversale]KAF9914750.1 hypothetical protein BX616_007638 [Lobosporangium transversale]ORZ08018.1 hypothetical protein BCR41DRAFT_388743 [Lobosporangium transversale]|eukprot:XP_021878252.1 hypothetical protein BCR41DRAFT_388743 [Lobosporangium transversale]
MLSFIPSCLSVLVMLAVLHPVEAQGTTSSSSGTIRRPSSSFDGSTPMVSSPTTTTINTTPSSSTLSTTTTTTVIPITTIVTTTITTTTTLFTIPSLTTTFSSATLSSIPSTTQPVNPITTDLVPSISQSSSQSPQASSDAGSSSSSPTNVPVIVGSIIGITALIIIIASCIICYHRRHHKSRELNFDTLQEMSDTPKKYASHGYLASSSPTTSGGAIGLNSTTSGGYDDVYNYEMQSNTGYPVQQQQTYNSGGYGPYEGSSSHQAYRSNPAIYHEDLPHLPMAAHYATTSSMGRNRAAFDRNLPQRINNNAPPVDTAPEDYYNDSNMYNSTVWNHDMQQGELWVINPVDQYTHHNIDHSDINHPYASAALPPSVQDRNVALQSFRLQDPTLMESPHAKFRDNDNPRGLPDSPILSSNMRDGDIFGPDNAARSASPRAMSSTVATGESISTSSSRIASNRELHNCEPSRHSPRNSNEGVQDYAGEYASFGNIAPKKSLRTLRREDWS